MSKLQCLQMCLRQLLLHLLQRQIRHRQYSCSLPSQLSLHLQHKLHCDCKLHLCCLCLMCLCSRCSRWTHACKCCCRTSPACFTEYTSTASTTSSGHAALQLPQGPTVLMPPGDTAANSHMGSHQLPQQLQQGVHVNRCCSIARWHHHSMALRQPNGLHGLSLWYWLYLYVLCRRQVGLVLQQHLQACVHLLHLSPQVLLTQAALSMQCCSTSIVMRWQRH